MNDLNQHTISPFYYTGNAISTRDSVRRFFRDGISSHPSILNVDFDGVDSISRAAAHEFLTLRKNFADAGGAVRTLNVHQHISDMLNLVSSSMLRSRGKSSSEKSDESKISTPTALLGVGLLAGAALYQFLSKK